MAGRNGERFTRFVRRWWFVAASVALAAVVFVLAMSTYPTPPVIKDSLGYTRTAQRLLHTGAFAYSADPISKKEPPNATVTPGYVLLLAGVYGVLGRGAGSADEAVASVQYVVIGLQFVMALAIVALISLSGHRLGGERLGVTAGILGALYVPFGLAASVALSELLGALLVAVQVLIALSVTRKGQPPPLAAYAGLGLTSALIGLVRPVYAFWSLIPLGYALRQRRGSMRHVSRALAAFTIAFVLVMAPWWSRNVVTLRQLVVFRTDAGAPMLDAVGGQPLTASEQAVVQRAEAAGQDGLAVVAMQRQRSEFTASPSGFLAARVVRMLAAATSSWDAVYDVYLDEYVQPDKARIVVDPWFAPPPSALFLTSEFLQVRYQWVIVAGSLIALLFVRRSPRVLVLASLPLYSFATHSLTLFSDRYYFPVMPAVIVMAAAGYYGAYQFLKRRLVSVGQPMRVSEDGFPSAAEPIQSGDY